MKTLHRYFVIVIVVIAWCALTETLYAGTGPMEQLRPSLTNLTNLLSNPDLQGAEHRMERRQRIMDAIKEGFNFREMSRRILGSTWNDISPEQQDNFTRQMTNLLENAYIGKLENYSGQTIGYVGERIKGDRAQVSTLVEDGNIQVPVHYVMSLDHGNWMVYDINIEGVSLVRNYMEQFRSILRKEQYAGLIKVIEEKNKSFLAGGGDK